MDQLPQPQPDATRKQQECAQCCRNIDKRDLTTSASHLRLLSLIDWLCVYWFPSMTLMLPDEPAATTATDAAARFTGAKQINAIGHS